MHSAVTADGGRPSLNECSIRAGEEAAQPGLYPRAARVLRGQKSGVDAHLNANLKSEPAVLRTRLLRTRRENSLLLRHFTSRPFSRLEVDLGNTAGTGYHLYCRLPQAFLVFPSRFVFPAIRTTRITQGDKAKTIAKDVSGKRAV